MCRVGFYIQSKLKSYFHILLCFIFEREVQERIYSGITQQLSGLRTEFSPHQNGSYRRGPGGMVYPLLLELVRRPPTATIEPCTGGLGALSSTYFQSSLCVRAAGPR